MELARPFALALLALLVPFVWLLRREATRRHALLASYADPVVWRAIRPEHAARRERHRVTLTALALGLGLFAFAGPRWGTVYEDASRRGIDVVVGVDVSRSMLAEDFAPNRLQKAKHQLDALLEKLQGDRVAVMAFAGEAYLYCPLTLDYSAARLYLGILSPDAIPTPGTNLEDAIRTGARAFESAERKHKVLLLLTDGENLQGKTLDAARDAAAEGVVIYAIGIGSPEGAPIPIRDAAGEVTYKKDASGKVVMSKLDEDTLKAVAEASGGAYYQSSYGEIELDWFLEEIARMEKKDLKSQVVTRKKDRFWLFAFAAFALLLIEAALPDGPLPRLSRRAERAPDEKEAA
ncbi:VWA domain-containing protein [bacterium]|nr:VWA domain-containing protein [bacterium]